MIRKRFYLYNLARWHQKKSFFTKYISFLNIKSSRSLKTPSGEASETVSSRIRRVGDNNRRLNPSCLQACKQDVVKPALTGFETAQEPCSMIPLIESISLWSKMV